MLDQKLIDEVHAWIDDDPDPKTAEQLESYLASGNEEALAQCFSGFLTFGTAGLRGALGPGPSHINRAVVGRTASGLAIFMKRRGLRSIVIGRDARHGSDDFARDTAEIMAGAGFDVHLLPRPLPTPVLAFAVRHLAVDVGVMVTASHNPATDNGYKVYLGGIVDGIPYNGSQIISPIDEEIFHDIQSVTSLKSVIRGSNWNVLDEKIIRAYVHATAAIAKVPRDIKVVYTAMHGVGTETLRSVFHAAGFAEPILVSAQAEPDPDFPTAQFPNPEEPGAIDLALETARSFNADIVIANDPDADRCAVAINDGQWRMLRGDEVGAILGEYLARENAKGVFANSIVSSSLLSKIADKYGIKFVETLTGFKYLSKIPNLTFGYEEALGYCVDSHSVNDKDGISAGLKIVEIAAELKSKGSSLSEFLAEIWATYGYYFTSQISLRASNLTEMRKVMTALRSAMPHEIAGFKVSRFTDLALPTDGLPPTDGIRFWLGDAIRIIIRPSGTEPKIKCYIEITSHGDLADNQAIATLARLQGPLTSLLVK
jgi:phosphomannomutase